MPMKKSYYAPIALLAMLMLLLIAPPMFAQNATVTGKITDASGPVAGVAVMIDGTNIGVASDRNGIYQIPNVPPQGTLVYSIVGYVTQTVPVRGRTEIDIVLQEDKQVIEDVVVIGYGVVRKSDLTGAVASVKADEVIKNTPTGNISDALQGRLAGVSVVSGSGNPAVDNTIRVRGINSVSAETGPLVVVDGFIGGSLKTLNPSDILSIEILKDASATAVYGSRGANGVILVTTRTPDKGSINISFNGFANVKNVAKYPDTLSPYEYALLANEFGKEYYGSGDNYYYSAAQLAAFKNGTAGFDYSRAIFRDPAISQNYEMSVSGGSSMNTFLASVRYEKAQGVIQKSDNTQYSWRLKVDAQAKKWLNLGINYYGSYGYYNNPRITTYDGLIQQARYFPPTIEPKDENGNYNNYFIDGTATYNPMGMIWEANNKYQSLANRLQGYAEFKIIDGLTFRSQLGFSFLNYLNNTAENEQSYYYFKNNVGTQATASSTWSISWLNTNMLTYVKEFNEYHRINATAVFEQSYGNSYSHNSVANQVDYIDILSYNALGWSNSTLSTVSSNRTINTMMSGLLRVNYVLMNRYMVTASMRADGSSRLNQKWSYFPSAAVAWNVKEERFLKDVDAISQLKLRVGYGSVGNQAVDAYRIYSKMSPTRNADGTTSYTVDRPQANYLTWERNDQLNIGVDMGFFNNRLSITADCYKKTSKDILLELAQPSHMGYTTLLTNSGEITNKGIEITIGADPVAGKDLRWHTDLTLTKNVGIYSKIPTPTHRQQQGTTSANQLFYMVEGEKLGTIWGFVCEGVWQEDEVSAPYVDADGNPNGKTNGQVYKVKAGNTKLRDVNKDGKYNVDDQGIIGCGQPVFNWGWNNVLYWKGLDLSLFVVGFHGFDIYNVTRQCGYYNTVTGQNMSIVPNNPDLKNRWTPTNTNTDVPGFVNGGTENKVFTSRFIEDGSFVKIKNITLGYSLPDRVCKTIGIANARVYCSIQNPFIFTKYSGLDPEATLGSPLIQGVDWAEYPNSKNFLIGASLSF